MTSDGLRHSGDPIRSRVSMACVPDFGIPVGGSLEKKYDIHVVTSVRKMRNRRIAQEIDST